MATAVVRNNKTRSPNYPAIGLGEAIQRLRRIYDTQRRYPATREILVKLMGYGTLNGASATVVSALSKYGLLEGHGDQLRVSEMGQDLVLHRKGDQEYTEALRTAAFMPAFFQELRGQYPEGLPSEHALRATLIKRGFNPKAIDGAVRAYRDTIEFLDAEVGSEAAKPLENPGSGAYESQDERPRDESPGRRVPPSPSDEGQRAVMLPLAVGEWATLHAAFPLSETSWTQMMAVLNAMKPALVAAPEPERPSMDHSGPIEPVVDNNGESAGEST
jgi:hypothetical protein